jgi:hypothetical protein
MAYQHYLSIVISYRIASLLDTMQKLLLEVAMVSQEVFLNPYTVSLALCSSLRHRVVDNLSHANRERYYEPFFATTYMLLL